VGPLLFLREVCVRFLSFLSSSSEEGADIKVKGLYLYSVTLFSFLEKKYHFLLEKVIYEESACFLGMRLMKIKFP
jgi:hypothetical protein